MKLETEDYENIWLRCQEKFRKWVTGYLLVILGIPSILVAFFTYYKLDDIIQKEINNKISIEVQKNFESKKFIDNLTNNIQIKLNNLQIDLSKIEKKLHYNKNEINNILSTFQNKPIVYKNNVLSITNTYGNQLILEHQIYELKASLQGKKKIIFTKSFEKIPIVYLDLIPENNKLIKTRIKITKITKKNFEIQFRTNSHKSIRFTWFAMGSNKVLN